MNARVRELLDGAIQSDGIEELFETGKHISVDIFSDEYMDKINAIQLPNTKIKILQRLLHQKLHQHTHVGILDNSRYDLVCAVLFLENARKCLIILDNSRFLPESRQ